MLDYSSTLARSHPRLLSARSLFYLFHQLLACSIVWLLACSSTCALAHFLARLILYMSYASSYARSPTYPPLDTRILARSLMYSLDCLLLTHCFSGSFTARSLDCSIADRSLIHSVTCSLPRSITLLPAHPHICLLSCSNACRLLAHVLGRSLA